MKFERYSKIENHYRTEFIERIKLEGMDGGHWIATEKIHGANFSIWVNATRTRIAKRKNLMKDETAFYHVQHIAPALREKARELFRLVHRLNQKPKEIGIYGELFGGSYPHPKVIQSPRYSKVQSGVWYSPELQFAVYDIKVDGEYLSWDAVCVYCNGVGFLTVPVICDGTLEECLNIRNDYVSKVYKLFNLPIIKGNTMEGLVIRPVNTRYLRRGERVIIKSKNKKFSETRDRKPRKAIKLPKAGEEIVNVAFGMINENRYDAVVSKIGEVTPKDFNRILGLIIQDIHQEVIDTYPVVYMGYQQMDKAEQNLVHRVLAPEVAVLIRHKLLGILPTRSKDNES